MADESEKNPFQALAEGSSDLDARDRAIMLALAGTTTLPQPYPQVGEIRVRGEGQDSYLEVRVARPLYQVVRYTLHADNLRAVYLAEEPPQRLEPDHLLIGAGLLSRIAAGVTGIVFVRDDAPVLVTHAIAVTAQEVPDFDWYVGCCDRPAGP